MEEDLTDLGPITNLGRPSVVSPTRVIFQAHVETELLSFAEGVLSYYSDEIVPIAVEPHVLPGGVEELAGFIPASQTFPYANSSGNVVMGAEISPVEGGGSDDGIFMFDHTTGTVKTIVRDGDLAADGNGYLFVSQTYHSAMNATGQVAYTAEISGAAGGLGNGGAIYRSDGPSRTRIMRTGQIPPHSMSYFTGYSWPSINNSGEVAFVGFTADGDEGVYLGDGQTLIEVARTGQTLPPSWTVSEFTPVSGVPINDSGHVAFRAEMETPTNGCCVNAIYLGDGQAAELIAYGGQPLERGEDWIPYGINRNVALNNSGHVAFMAAYLSREGVFRASADGLVTIAYSGDPVPDTISGTFRYLDGYPFALNQRGDVAFVSFFQNGGTSQEGLFFYSDESGLVPVVQPGTSLAGSTVHDFDFVGTDPSDFRPREPTGLNDAGEIVFRFELNDGRRGIALAKVCNADSSLDLFGLSIDDQEEREACHHIQVENVAVLSSGDLTLRAGDSVAFGDGFSVESGGRLEVILETP